MVGHDEIQSFNFELVTIQIAAPVGHRLGSTAWKRLRSVVIMRDDWRCQGHDCDRRNKLTVHHIIPRSAGGTDNLDNLITLCRECHDAIHR